MPFQPGNRANPRGRPSVGASLADAVRRKWPPEKIVELAEKHIASKDEEIAFKAFQFIADRGYGKPREAEVEEPAMTPEEYKRALAEIVREEVAAMSPEDRMRLLTNPEPTHTIQ